MIAKISDTNRAAATDYFVKRWYSDAMVISSGVYHIKELRGFIYTANSRIQGMITYDEKEVFEIISLDSSVENQGIGASLVAEIEKLSSTKQKNLYLVTTNDNLNALKFWQKRGFRITGIQPGAVDKVRKKKSSIPIIGDFGIPLHDEICLFKKLVN